MIESVEYFNTSLYSHLLADSHLLGKRRVDVEHSRDGQFLYYLEPPVANRTRLKQVPIGGGEEQVVLDEHVRALLWSVTKNTASKEMSR